MPAILKKIAACLGALAELLCGRTAVIPRPDGASKCVINWLWLIPALCFFHARAVSDCCSFIRVTARFFFGVERPYNLSWFPDPEKKRTKTMTSAWAGVPATTDELEPIREALPLSVSVAQKRDEQQQRVAAATERHQARERERVLRSFSSDSGDVPMGRGCCSSCTLRQWHQVLPVVMFLAGFTGLVLSCTAFAQHLDWPVDIPRVIQAAALGFLYGVLYTLTVVLPLLEVLVLLRSCCNRYGRMDSFWWLTGSENR